MKDIDEADAVLKKAETGGFGNPAFAAVLPIAHNPAILVCAALRDSIQAAVAAGELAVVDP